MSIKEIIPLLAAIIGLTPVFLKWLNDKSTEAAKSRSVQQAKEQVEFWQTWLQAQREVSTDEQYTKLKNEVSQRLNQLIQKNDEIEIEEKMKQTDSDEPFFLQKIFLLYMPHSASGWIFHTLFYIVISFSAMLTIGLAIDSTGEVSWDYFLSEIGTNLTILLILFGIALIFQRIARRTERKHEQKLKDNKKPVA